MGYRVLIFIITLYSYTLKADTWNKESEQNLLNNGSDYLYFSPVNCSTFLEAFALDASNFTMCSIVNASPVTLCSNCINQYMNFHKSYQELLTAVVNGTSCKSLYVSHDRLDAVIEYHDNILSIWDKGHCSACFNWTSGIPVLSEDTKHFNSKYTETKTCIDKYSSGNSSDEVCNKCMQSYVQLDSYYKSLSTDSIGLDSICMDIVDSMNATRSIWSKTLNCCKLRQTPEIVFLCCSAIISMLPLFYYLVLRYFGPIRDLPNVLKQSRFKQTLLRSVNRRNHTIQ